MCAYNIQYLHRGFGRRHHDTEYMIWPDLSLLTICLGLDKTGHFILVQPASLFEPVDSPPWKLNNMPGGRIAVCSWRWLCVQCSLQWKPFSMSRLCVMAVGSAIVRIAVWPVRAPWESWSLNNLMDFTCMAQCGGKLATKGIMLVKE